MAPKNETVSQEVISLLKKEPPLIIPAQALVEAYSVLTRMPPPYRTSPKTAAKALRESFHAISKIVSLKGDLYWSQIEYAVENNIHSGAIYDVFIAACARKGGANKLLTLNCRHFELIAGSSLKIIVPE